MRAKVVDSDLGIRLRFIMKADLSSVFLSVLLLALAQLNHWTCGFQILLLVNKLACSEANNMQKSKGVYQTKAMVCAKVHTQRSRYGQLVPIYINVKVCVFVCLNVYN